MPPFKAKPWTLKTMRELLNSTQEMLDAKEAELQKALDTQEKLSKHVETLVNQRLEHERKLAEYAALRLDDMRKLRVQEQHVERWERNEQKRRNNTFTVSVQVDRGGVGVSTQSFTFERGAHTLNVIVDSGGSVRGVLGDIADMRERGEAELKVTPLQIHRQPTTDEHASDANTYMQPGMSGGGWNGPQEYPHHINCPCVICKPNQPPAAPLPDWVAEQFRK